MKKLFALAIASMLIFAGCSSGGTGEGTNEAPQLTAQFNDGSVDIAAYKVFWNGKSYDRTVEDSTFDSYESVRIDAGDKLAFKFAENAPGDVTVTEYIVSDDDVAIASDDKVIINSLDSTYSNSEVSFKTTATNASGRNSEERIYVIGASWGNDDNSNSVKYAFAAVVRDKAAEPAEPTRTPAVVNSYDGVSMTISADSVTPTGVIADITNENEDTAVFGTKYRIDVYEDGDWYTIDYLPSVISVVWNDVAYEVSGTFKLPVNWEEYFGALEPGEYRLVKDFFFEKDSGTDYQASAEFTVE